MHLRYEAVLQVWFHCLRYLPSRKHLRSNHEQLVFRLASELSVMLVPCILSQAPQKAGDLLSRVFLR